MFTFYVNEGLEQGPVRSSAMLSLTVALFFHFFPSITNAYLVKNIPLVFIGSSFIGMVSGRLVSGYWLIGLAGVVFCIIFLNASRFFTGYGGALGISACISLLAILSIPIVTKKHRLTNGFALLRKTVFKIRKK
ncbi:hypothetical protein [Pedobacter miscanthi]|uniref:hypothetical protein n=1 Tax=Pedobacter miscanthi TaxID=2259170 RepID=UPI00292FB789|nr:hypothetical protein [Pedobacter miscanthi]